VGIVFPLWNGGEDSHREEAYKSEAEAENERLKAAQLEFSAKLKDLRDEWARDKETLQELEHNLELVHQTMKLASKRYRALEGPLIDVREAFSQLRSMERERIQLMHTLGEVGLQLQMLRVSGG